MNLKNKNIPSRDFAQIVTLPTIRLKNLTTSMQAEST